MSINYKKDLSEGILGKIDKNIFSKFTISNFGRDFGWELGESVKKAKSATKSAN